MKYFKSKTTEDYFKEEELDLYLRSQLFTILLLNGYYLETDKNTHIIGEKYKMLYQTQAEIFENKYPLILSMKFGLVSPFMDETWINIDFPSELSKYGYFPDCPQSTPYYVYMDRSKSEEYQKYSEESIRYQSNLTLGELKVIKDENYEIISEEEYLTKLESDKNKAVIVNEVNRLRDSYFIKKADEVPLKPSCMTRLELLGDLPELNSEHLRAINSVLQGDKRIGCVSRGALDELDGMTVKVKKMEAEDESKGISWGEI